MALYTVFSFRSGTICCLQTYMFVYVLYSITYLCKAIQFGGRISVSLKMHNNQFDKPSVGICLVIKIPLR